MATIKYNAKAVKQARSERTEFEEAPVGLYPMKCVAAEDRKASGKTDIHLTFQILNPPKGTTYSQLHTYVNYESEAQAWKMEQMLDAFQVDPTGTLDLRKLINKEIMGKVVADEYDGEYKGRLGRMLPPKDAVDTGEDEDEDVPADDGEDDEAWTEDELTELDDETLTAVAEGDPEDDDDEGFGIDVSEHQKAVKRGKRTVKKLDRDALIAAILEAQEEGGEDEDGDGEEDDGYEEMSLADLRALAKEAGIATKGLKKDALVEALRESDVEGENDDDGEDGEPEDAGYEEMSIEELRAEAKERELPSKGSKKLLIARLTKDDEDDAPF